MNSKKDNTLYLPDAELDIMKTIWHAESPLTTNEIMEQLDGKRSWKRATLHVLLARLCDRGFLNTDKSERGFRYEPLISEEEYRHGEYKSLLQRVYDGSVKCMVASFIESNDIDDSDIDELTALLKQKKRELDKKKV